MRRRSNAHLRRAEVECRVRPAHLVVTVAVLVGAMIAGPIYGAGSISIVLNGGYNLVVDSNVCSPSTYAPRIATNGVGFCNYGDAKLTDVVAYVGDFSAGTPGVYPTRDSATAAGDICAESTCLCDSGTYSLTHIGDPDDAVRYIGDLEVGDCSWQYWSFTYPRLENGQSPGSGCDSPVWCATNDPNDDLWLTYDTWAVSAEGPEAQASRRVTMRNEISASANKIYPNNGIWFNEPASCLPGQTVTTNGINYELGVVNQGFDNDGDLLPDYNGWLQPIGDEGWNPSCFRLVNTYGQLQISRPSAPTEYLDFTNQLYFTNLGKNNGITGVVSYEFMCLGGGCEVPMTPYQEAASGFDNEKFAGDYGTSTTTLVVTSPEVSLDKAITDANDDGYAQNGETLRYDITLDNFGDEDLGAPELNMPLVVKDSIPAGTTYVAGSAGASFTCCTLDVLYSYDNRISWISTEPAANSVTDLMWRFQDQFPAGDTGTVTFDVVVDNPYVGDPLILNTAAASFGDSPPFDEDTVAIPTVGPNSIGDTVFADDGGSAGYLSAESGNGVQGENEGGLLGVTVTLYWDVNGDGSLDAGDMEAISTTTDGNGGYIFASIPDGDWLVVVSNDDTALPDGYRSTTPTEVFVEDLGVGVSYAVDFEDADFGFGPAVVVEKTLVSPCGEDLSLTYQIAVTNNLPADQPCDYELWAEDYDPALTAASNSLGATGADGPDGVYATLGEGGGGDSLRLTDFTLPGTIPGTIQTVELLFRIYVDDSDFTLSNDSLDFWVDDGSTEGTHYILTAAQLQANAWNTWYLHSQIITTDPNAWSYAEFENPGTYIHFDYKHAGGSDDAPLRVDAAGFRITTDSLCGAAGDDLSVVPLEDQFDNSYGMSFVVATRCGADTDAVNGPCGDADDRYMLPTSQATCTGGPSPPSTTCEYDNAGVIRWADVGPLLAGQTKFFTVTLAVPDGKAGETASNTALVCGPTGSSCNTTFYDGTAANKHKEAESCELLPTYSIGDTIWADADGDGTIDSGEEGFPGVTVNLWNCGPDGDCDTAVDNTLQASTVTDGTGWYDFSGLIAGDYRVVVDETTLPGTGFSLTGDPDEAGTCSTCDSQTDVSVPASGLDAPDFLDADFGYNQADVTVFGNVFYDWDGQGDRDPEDYGLGDGSGYVRVWLYDCGSAPATCENGGGDDTLVGTVWTNSFGDYIFTDVPVGNGQLQIIVDTLTLPGTGWQQTFDPDEYPPLPYLCSTCDSQTNAIPVVAGNAYGSYDFGYTDNTPTSSIGDTLYKDWDGDGTQEAGETGIVGVTVYLYQDDGDGIFDPVRDRQYPTDITDGTGTYLFTGLPAGDWFVWVDDSDPDLPSAFQQTQDPDEDGTTCSACDGVGSSTTDGDSSDLTVDFGYQPMGFASIGDVVWEDTDSDGIFDGTENGIGGITVTLYADTDGDGVLTSADARLESTVTDADGTYLFENLYAASGGTTYLVDVDQEDPQLPTDCGDDFVCSTTGDNNPYVLTSECTVLGCSGSDAIAVTLTSNNQVFLDADFGFGPGAVIGDTIWADYNGDGEQAFSDTDGDGDLDATEPGIPGITVTLYLDDGDGVYEPGGDDTEVQTRVTDSNGQYVFSGLPEGDYFVEFSTDDLPFLSYTITGDPDGVMDGWTLRPLSPGQIYLGADFGVQPPDAVGDLIWRDVNGNGTYWEDLDSDGIYDPDSEPIEDGEGGISGVELTLTDCGANGTCGDGDDVVLGTTTTDGSGIYGFGELCLAGVCGNGRLVQVSVDTSTLPAGVTWTLSGDPDHSSTCITDPPPVPAACDSVVKVTLDSTGALITPDGLGNFDLDFGYQPVPAPVIRIDKDTTTPTVAAGGQATFTIAVTNAGGSLAAGVRIFDDLRTWGSPGSCYLGNCARLADIDPSTDCIPAFTIVEVNATRGASPTNPTCLDTNLGWSDWDIQPAGSVTITYTVDVDAGIANGTYDNDANGDYAGGTVTFTDLGGTTQDPDTPPTQDPEADEDVTIASLPVLAVTKICTACGLDGICGNGDDSTTNVSANETIEFLISVTNSGTATASIFGISDPVPEGSTYVTNSSIISARTWIEEVTYADDFDPDTSEPPWCDGQADYDDDDYPNGEDSYPGPESCADPGIGSYPWSTAWYPGDGSAVVDLGDMSLQLGKLHDASRDLTANTGNADEAILSFDYRRVNIDSGDQLTVEGCGSTALTINGTSDGGTTTDQTDAGYIHRTVDISSFLPTSGDCEISFQTSSFANDGEYFYIDNVAVSKRLRSPMVTESANPPSLLVPEADNRELLSGESMSVSFRVTVDSPVVGVGAIDNTAFVEARELDFVVTDSCSLTINDAPTGSIAGTLWDDEDTDGAMDPGEPMLLGVRIELLDGTCDPLPAPNTCRLTTTDLVDGSYLFDNLPAGSYTVRVDESQLVTLYPSYAQSGDPDESWVTAQRCTTCDAEAHVDGTVIPALVFGDLNRIDVDFGYYHAITPLPVTLASFLATGDSGVVRFEWSTATETGNVGFFILGAQGEGWIPINAQLIPSRVVDSTIPQDYAYEAYGVESTSFLMADIDTKGDVRLHGPFALGDESHAVKPEMEAIPWGLIRQEHRAKVAKRRGGWNSRVRQEVYLYVEQEGVHRVTYEQLLAEGFDLTGVPLPQLAVLSRDQPIPIRVIGNGTFGPGSAIEFVGHASESLYSDVNVYTLTVNHRKALRVDVDQTPVPPWADTTTVYQETAVVENNLAYAETTPHSDPWYDALLMAISGPATLSRGVVIDDYAPGEGSVTLQALLWGVIDWPEDPDHHLRVDLNGYLAHDDVFDGMTTLPVAVEIPDDWLQEGPNQVTLTLPHDLGMPWDLVALDSYGVTYPRRLVAREGRLTFSATGEFLEVQGFPSQDIIVYRDLGSQIELIGKLRITGAPGNYTVIFPGSQNLERYVVGTASTALTPGIEPTPPRADLLTGPAEYLIIAHPDFIDGLEPLVTARENRFSVKVVSVDDVYARLSGGNVDALAIQEYVRLAAEKMGTRYVLLVGGDSYDYKDYLGLGSMSFIPSLYVPTGLVVRFAPGDPLYGDLDDDGIPELAVGRLPVRTGAELENAIGKILSYEAKVYGRTLLSATDFYDEYMGVSFVAASDMLLSAVDSSWIVEKADMDDLGLAGARVKLIETLNQGVAFGQYFGHSAPTMWSFKRLFTMTDARQLQNEGRPTVIAQWGCWNTYYVDPYYNTLGHELMLSGERGAAAVLGAATLTATESDVALGQHLLPRIVQPEATIGMALVEAKRALALEHPEMIDVIYGWTILGDPALPVLREDE